MILLPSGDQTGKSTLVPLAVSPVRCLAPEPSEFTTHTLRVPLVLSASVPSRARPDAEAILLPSADQTGLKLLAKVEVSLVNAAAPVPSGFTTQMFAVLLMLAASLPSNARDD